MLCFGLHHYKQNPPINAAENRPTLANKGSRLWAAECPIHPVTIWEKPKHTILTIPMLVRHPVMNVEATIMINNTSMAQLGLKRG
jgi:hypothetical protein